MGNSYLDVLERIANALEQQNGIPIWEILITKTSHFRYGKS